IGDDAGDYFASLGTHVGAGKHIAEVFVLAGVLHIDGHSEFVERLLEVHDFGAKAFEKDRLFVAQVDALGGKRDVILAASRRAQKCVQGLAGLAELFEIGANLFELGPAGAQSFRLYHHGADMRIGRGFAQHHPYVGERERGASAQNSGKFERRLFGDVAGEAQDHHRVAGNLRRLFAEAKQGEKDEYEAEENEEDAGDQPDDELDHSYSESSMG